MNLRTTILSTAALIGLSTAAAQAVPISGSYALTVAQVMSDTVDLSMASSILFSGSVLTPANTITSFLPVSFTPTLTACLNCGTINNITGIPAGSATTPFTAISPLFTIQGLSFSLTNLSQVLRSSTAQGSSLELKGTGIYSAAGYEDTVGSFDITAQNGSIFVQTESASASGNVPLTVPEPGSLAILGASLAAVGFVRGRKAGQP